MGTGVVTGLGQELGTGDVYTRSILRLLFDRRGKGQVSGQVVGTIDVGTSYVGTGVGKKKGANSWGQVSGQWFGTGDDKKKGANSSGQMRGQ